MKTKTRLDAFLSGAKGSLTAWHFMAKHKLWYFFLFPIILHLLLAMGITALIREAAQVALGPISQWLQIESLNSNDWRDILVQSWNAISTFALQLFIWIFGFLLYLKFAKYLLLALMAPVMAYMSEKTEEIIRGTPFPFSLSDFLKNTLRGAIIALRNLFIELVALAIIAILNLLISLFVPPLALFTVPLSILASTTISAYFFGFSTFDYILERQHYSVRNSVQFARANKALLLGNGGLFLVLHSIPWIGTSVALVTATVGAVISFYDMEKRNLNTSE
jgi:CysZ protein